MTIHLLASELAAAVPELQRDSIVNNEKYFEGKLREFLDATRCSPPAGVPESELPTVEEIQKFYREYRGY